MKLAFLELPAAEQQVYIEQAATQRNVSPILLEKDWWVSWLLGVLFESEFSNALVFKGGTSLSKVFGIIERFSEDIDLSLAPEFLQLPPAGASRTQSDKWMKNAEAACSRTVATHIAPKLEMIAKQFLGERSTPWFEYQLDAVTSSPVVLFHYPTCQPQGFAYLNRFVKLEFGSLTDQQPTGRHPIAPWLAEIFPTAFTDWRCSVVALELERTFWEKATILHAEHHRPAERSLPDRFSRHYADTAALAQHPVANLALQNHALRERVVGWKSRFFSSGWARYDLAQPPTFRLLPPLVRHSVLRRDYDAMRPMYLQTPLPFDEVLAVLSDLERRINGA